MVDSDWKQWLYNVCQCSIDQRATVVLLSLKLRGSDVHDRESLSRQRSWLCTYVTICIAQVLQYELFTSPTAYSRSLRYIQVDMGMACRTRVFSQFHLVFKTMILYPTDNLVDSQNVKALQAFLEQKRTYPCPQCWNSTLLELNNKNILPVDTLLWKWRKTSPQPEFHRNIWYQKRFLGMFIRAFMQPHLVLEK